MSLKSSVLNNREESSQQSLTNCDATVLCPSLSTPFLNGGTIDRVTEFKRQQSQLKSSTGSTLAWNMEDILEAYVVLRNLPPPLSPTIPPIEAHDTTPILASPEKILNADNKEKSALSQSSNDLKSSISDRAKHGMHQENSLTLSKEATPRHDASMERSSNRVAAKEPESGDSRDKELEKSSLQVLSPRLPVSFNNARASHKKSKAKLPANRRSETKGVVSIGNFESSNTAPAFKNIKTDAGVFKWINKMNDPTKPKFLLRITVNNRSKFKEKVTTSSKSSKSVNDHKETTNKQINSGDNDNSDVKEYTSGSSQTAVNDQVATIGEPKETHHYVKKQKKAQPEMCHDAGTKLYNMTKDKQKHEKKLEELVKLIEEKDKSIEEKDKLLTNKSSRLEILESELEALRAKNESDHKQKQAGVFINGDIVIERSTSVTALKLTKDQSEEVKTKLTMKKKYWLDICKNVQKDIDSIWKKLELARGSFPESWKGFQIVSDDVNVVIMQVDVFIMKMVSLDYDERSKIVTETLPSERSWKALDKDVERLITYIGLLLSVRDNNLGISKSDQFEIDFLRTIKCLMYQTRALILKRINSILLKVVDKYIEKIRLSQDEAKPTSTGSQEASLSQKIIELQQLNLKNSESVQELFVNSQPEYLNSILQSTFPCVWEKRTSNLAQVVQSYNLDAFDKSIKPSLQTYYLPMGVYSNLNEVNSILFNVVVYFLETYNKFHPNQNVDYKLQSSQT